MWLGSMDVAKARILLDVSTSLGFRFSVENKYTRVERALAAEMAAYASSPVAVLDDCATFVSARQAFASVVLNECDVRAGPGDRSQSRESRHIIDRSFRYVLGRLRDRPGDRQSARDLIWRIIYAYEALRSLLRRRAAAQTNTTLIDDLSQCFHRWRGQRDVELYWKPFAHLLDAVPEFDYRKDDILILAGASWCHLDFARMQQLKHVTGLTIVCFVYDLLPLRYPSFITVAGRKRYRQFLASVGSVADLIVTPSTTVAAELRAFMAMEGMSCAPRIAPISLASAALPSGRGAPPSRLRKLRLDEKRFVLCVSPLRRRKHVLWLYSLWVELWKSDANSPILVCAGRLAEPNLLYVLQSDPLWTTAGVFLADPSDAELHWLYEHAMLCLHPSFEGGLGMPIREAFNHGKPCIAADAPSLRETSAGQALHLPQDRAAWMAMIRALVNKANNPSLSEPGHAASARPLLDQIFAELMPQTDCGQ